MSKFVSILSSWHVNLSLLHILVMWVTLEVFQTVKSLAVCQELQAELFVRFVEGGLTVGHFLHVYVPHMSSAKIINARVPQATLLKTPGKS